MSYRVLMNSMAKIAIDSLNKNRLKNLVRKHCASALCERQNKNEIYLQLIFLPNFLKCLKRILNLRK